MAVVRTDRWMDEDLSTIHEKILETMHVKSTTLLRSLMQNGMSNFNWSSLSTIEAMKDNKLWEAVVPFFEKYREAWRGPDVPVFLFPAKAGWFTAGRKSGVAYPEGIFLFVPQQVSLEELEALFVHEYHHVTRMRKLVGPNNTLLDTIIMEGLAEKAVEECCGKQYLAPWNQNNEEETLLEWYQNHFEENLGIKKDTWEHHELLYGGRSIPTMAGYRVGFYLVTQFAKKQHFSTVDLLRVPAKKFV